MPNWCVSIGDELEKIDDVDEEYEGILNRMNNENKLKQQVVFKTWPPPVEPKGA